MKLSHAPNVDATSRLGIGRRFCVMKPIHVYVCYTTSCFYYIHTQVLNAAIPRIHISHSMKRLQSFLPAHTRRSHMPPSEH